MSSDDMTNLHILKNIENPDFMDELEYSVSTLKAKQADQYFTILINHFQSEIPEEIGKSILIAISKVICVDDFLTCFLKNEFQLQLPYKKKQFAPEIFDILYVLVTAAPIVFDDKLSKCFGTIIKRDPQKSLTLLATYSQHFNDIDDPWSMVDLLIYEAHRFSSSSTAAYYAKLLAFLCRKYPDYCKGRAANAWRKICLLLQMKDIQTLQSVYLAMFSITEVYKEAESPVDLMLPHLSTNELRDSVLTLLLAAPPFSRGQNRELLRKLIQISTSNHHATLVLMRMATDVEFSKYLINNASMWMTQELPTYRETLRLFLVVFAHQELHNMILDCDYFVSFLTTCAIKGEEIDLIILCTVLRRVDLTEQFVSTSEFNEFMKIYFDSATNQKSGSKVTPQSIYSAILLTSTVSMIGYLNVFSAISKYLAQIIKERNGISCFAVEAAIILCGYDRCRKVFNKEELLSFLRNNLNTFTGKMKQAVPKLIQVLQEQ